MPKSADLDHRRIAELIDRVHRNRNYSNLSTHLEPRLRIEWKHDRLVRDHVLRAFRRSVPPDAVGTRKETDRTGPYSARNQAERHPREISADRHRHMRFS